MTPFAARYRAFRRVFFPLFSGTPMSPVGASSP